MCKACTSKPGELKHVKYLCCSDCPLLTGIPNIIGLKTLYCRNCPLLTHIPNIVGLNTLDCRACPLLTSIPHIVGLEIILCSYCPLLTSIPNIFGLKILDCSDSRLLTSIPNIDSLIELDCLECPWINNNKDYTNNIAKLTILQKWFKRTRLVKNIIKRSMQIVPYWWAPDAHGGYFHKLGMLGILSNIKEIHPVSIGL
jgi:hypothetical protein